MKRITSALVLVASLCFTSTLQLQAQAQKKSFVIERKAVSNLSSTAPDYEATLLVKEMPKQGVKKMVNYYYPEGSGTAPLARPSATVPTPVLGQSFRGNPFSVSTPCDNDLAISDTGFIVSTVNTNIFFKDANTAQVFPTKSLGAFTSPINNKHQEFDPKVIYDPEANRFILMCLVGFVDTTSKVIVGFSQTSDPTGSWNLYTLPGDPLNTGHWTDYPMVSLTKKDFYLSVNLLYNDSSWQTGFVQTVVWQIKKKDGYLGLPLTSDLHFNINYNGRPIRNLCPAKGGSQLYGPNMYFASNRNLASRNDTVFLVNIADTTGAASNTVTTKALITNQAYFFPPDGLQPLSTQSLATNDARNLGAFYENNKIQYVHNTKNPANGKVTIYHGTIDNVSSPSPSVTGVMLANDTSCYAYPNISFCGAAGGADNKAMITFDHSSSKVNPGVSAIQCDGQGNYSDILRIQNGAQSVNLLNSNLERWGDYSGSQRRYNRTNGEIWMSGYYGYAHSANYPRAHAAWIAQLTPGAPAFDDTGLLSTSNDGKPVAVYPNPASDRVTIDFSLVKPEYLNFELYDLQGKLVTVLLRDWVRASDNTFSFNTRDLKSGQYLLRVSGNNGTNISKKLVVD